MPIAENIQMTQAFPGSIDPAQAGGLSQQRKAWVGGDVETVRVDHVSALKDLVTDERLLQNLSVLQARCPDLEVTIEDTIAEGDKVVVRFAIANHQSANNQASAPGILIYRVSDGKIVEHWLQPDLPALLQVLGTAPTPALT
jgi:predicted ester cyclase